MNTLFHIKKVQNTLVPKPYRGALWRTLKGAAKTPDNKLPRFFFGPRNQRTTYAY